LETIYPIVTVRVLKGCSHRASGVPVETLITKRRIDTDLDFIGFAAIVAAALAGALISMDCRIYDT